MGDKMDLCTLQGWRTFSPGQIRDLYTHHIYKDHFFVKSFNRMVVTTFLMNHDIVKQAFCIVKGALIITIESNKNGTVKSFMKKRLSFHNEKNREILSWLELELRKGSAQAS
jgi:hypothetical protein